MLFWNKICGFTAIFFLCAFLSSAQTVTPVKILGNELLQSKYPKSLLTSNILSLNKELLSLTRPLAVIQQNFYTQHFGIMCKKELALEKATKIPFRLRLGSLQHCNYLEGKR
jgi:hypothetical protein